MNKQEFIDGLRRSLSSINDYTFVNDTISYYENYIESQIRMGKPEAEVMEELGDPRLIAKSIKATHVSEDESQQTYSQDEYEQKHPLKNSLFSFNGKNIQLPAWVIKGIVIIVLVLIIFLVFTVLRWLSPFIFMGLIAYMVYKAIFGKY